MPARAKPPQTRRSAMAPNSPWKALNDGCEGLAAAGEQALTHLAPA
ncbi:hypothetical protein DB30_04785 [Enhygromyxa salina]|uniref:Uncharacterized protein n=1 Tax=Enhygromyxa salina TaxID=215803 RepID=A0A0C2D3L9_9BACT|nr:hypothetical protein DB30_04785 [Enhygromyxa salina]